jgi:hypothetical protein
MYYELGVVRKFQIPQEVRRYGWRFQNKRK